MRKGSLSLSINAIVVLVLAITMLGLGLAFTKGKFSDLGERIEVPEPDYPATAEKPIVLSVTKVALKQGRPGGFSVNYYNGVGSTDYVPCLSCKDSTGFDDVFLEMGSDDDEGLFDSVYVRGSEYGTFKLILNSPGPGFPGYTGQALCTIGFIPSNDATDCDDTATFTDTAQLTLKIQ